MIKVVNIEDAVGQPLAHDITEIRAGEFKGPAFQRGDILTCRDLDHLRRLGKDHLYVIKPEASEMHEDDAAMAMADALCGDGVSWDEAPREGKIALRATRDGLLKVNVEVLEQFNEMGIVMCATRHTNTVVRKKDQVAATRAIPLLIAKEYVDGAVAIAKSAPDSILQVRPMMTANAGVMITGSEVYNGRIEDKFESIIRKKVAAFGGGVLDVVFLPDDDKMIASAARELLAKGANILITTGGMSVDPDDRTRFALKEAGARNMVYGTPVLPGAMFMVAYINEIPVLGIPACGLFSATTMFDLIYPRVLAGDKISRSDIAAKGHGGLCLGCKTCTYPRCAFGK
ncbi:Probable molybdopterin binding domain-containing protein [Desulfocicer vacuolatum DSM 3385]|uniref:Molybdopterin molybdenumtransferase n=1 Tax=Desulfocicer vacuolatum DSM 3385 TaxID=1121400 RepID=A0A1W1ZW92_9BACT|nr:molybdopterin-binding protein [Desulfocicer vacuolatum]SMC52677.1 Probable molybdopterin binding domain-containing protein [Desulfocicer vacuolatum DSM 3385]